MVVSKCEGVIVDHQIKQWNRKPSLLKSSFMTKCYNWTAWKWSLRSRTWRKVIPLHVKLILSMDWQPIFVPAAVCKKISFRTKLPSNSQFQTDSTRGWTFATLRQEVIVIPGQPRKQKCKTAEKAWLVKIHVEMQACCGYGLFTKQGQCTALNTRHLPTMGWSAASFFSGCFVFFFFRLLSFLMNNDPKKSCEKQDFPGKRGIQGPQISWMVEWICTGKTWSSIVFPLRCYDTILMQRPGTSWLIDKENLICSYKDSVWMHAHMKATLSYVREFKNWCHKA